MTEEQERELFRLVKENNVLLRLIIKSIKHDDANDFMMNILANVVGNRIDGRNKE